MVYIFISFFFFEQGAFGYLGRAGGRFSSGPTLGLGELSAPSTLSASSSERTTAAFKPFELSAVTPKYQLTLYHSKV